MNHDKKHFYLPAGEIERFGNGSARRSAQIFTLLKDHFDIENVAQVKSIFHSRSARYLSGIHSCIAHKIPVKSLKDIAVAGHHYLNVKGLVGNSTNRILFWESTLLVYPFKPSFFKQVGCKLICFPHNLESLVPGQVSSISGKASPSWFDEELLQFKQCDHIFTISREEEWLLSLYGIPCSWLPYYPAEEVVADLLEIRKFRKENGHENFFLIFGSFFYPPIRNGINEIIEFTKNNNLSVPLKIAGFGSEEILNLHSNLPASIEILGAVTTRELLDLQRRCKGIIINQQVSSGALTKLVEIQLAGIPVVVNHHSLRSYGEAGGLSPFYSLQELPCILESVLTTPELPEKPDKYYRQAVEIISRLS